MAHGFSCSLACGVFPDQKLNLCPRHWQADSFPLEHREVLAILIFNDALCPHQLPSDDLVSNTPTLLQIYCRLLQDVPTASWHHADFDQALRIVILERVAQITQVIYLTLPCYAHHCVLRAAPECSRHLPFKRCISCGESHPRRGGTVGQLDVLWTVR